jgi:hypothetical protein
MSDMTTEATCCFAKETLYTKLHSIQTPFLCFMADMTTEATCCKLAYLIGKYLEV